MSPERATERHREALDGKHGELARQLAYHYKHVAGKPLESYRRHVQKSMHDEIDRVRELAM